MAAVMRGGGERENINEPKLLLCWFGYIFLLEYIKFSLVERLRKVVRMAEELLIIRSEDLHFLVRSFFFLRSFCMVGRHVCTPRMYRAVRCREIGYENTHNRRRPSAFKTAQQPIIDNKN